MIFPFQGLDIQTTPSQADTNHDQQNLHKNVNMVGIEKGTDEHEGMIGNLTQGTPIEEEYQVNITWQVFFGYSCLIQRVELESVSKKEDAHRHQEEQSKYEEEIARKEIEMKNERESFKKKIEQLENEKEKLKAEIKQLMAKKDVMEINESGKKVILL